MRVLILGATGMLGSAMLRVLSIKNFDVFATARNTFLLHHFTSDLQKKIITGIDGENLDSITKIFTEIKPTVVINCIGLVSQLKASEDPLQAIPINSLLPHKLANLCKLADARLIHISTDCVFSGSKGNYTESDYADSYDLYGRSKFLGEVHYPHTVTLRTSIIGRELAGNRSLIDWFLSQEDEVKGYKNAVYSGLTTIELSRVICDYVLPNKDLFGLYHVASDPVSKYDLLSLVEKVYNKKIKIVPVNEPKIDKSLNASYFNGKTGYKPPAWDSLIQKMYEFR